MPESNKYFLLIITLAMYLTPCYADQILLSDARKAEKVFWEHLYAGPGYTLYCGERFSGKSEKLSIEFVYPIEWVVEYLGCQTIAQCRSESVRFNRIEADLHNYYPVLQTIRRARSDFKYGDIPGEFREFFECDFEHDVRTSTIEPREIARGNIARSLFYMHWEYGLPLNRQSIDVLLSWHAKDPPSNDEKRRNQIIEKSQGTRNSFIDNPQKAEKIVENMGEPVFKPSSEANTESGI